MDKRDQCQGFFLDKAEPLAKFRSSSLFHIKRLCKDNSDKRQPCRCLDVEIIVGGCDRISKHDFKIRQGVIQRPSMLTLLIILQENK